MTHGVPESAMSPRDSQQGERLLSIQAARTRIVIDLVSSSLTAALFRGGYGYPLHSGGMWMHAL
eukprot:6367341-Karenia_brevis.AAC.1